MTFVPFKAKFEKNDIVGLREDMASYKTNIGGVFSAGHAFKVTSLYIGHNEENLRRFGVLQPLSTMKGGTAPYIYSLESVEDSSLTCQCEEMDLKLVKKGKPDDKSDIPIYSRIGKEKTTTHTKPRTDVSDKKLKAELVKVAAQNTKEQAAKVKPKLSLNIRRKNA